VEVLKNFMADKYISKGVQASSTRVLQTSLSTGRCSIRTNPTNEQRSKHHGDLSSVKHITSILPYYILPLASVVNRENIPRGFEYTFITAYIPKGIHIVGN
jgi:hypothetical protein